MLRETVGRGALCVWLMRVPGACGGCQKGGVGSLPRCGMTLAHGSQRSTARPRLALPPRRQHPARGALCDVHAPPGDVHAGAAERRAPGAAACVWGGARKCMQARTHAPKHVHPCARTHLHTHARTQVVLEEPMAFLTSLQANVAVDAKTLKCVRACAARVRALLTRRALLAPALQGVRGWAAHAGARPCGAGSATTV